MLLLFRINLSETVAVNNSSSGQGFLFLTHLLQGTSINDTPVHGGGGSGYLYPVTRKEYLEFLRLEEKKRKKKLPEIVSDIVEDLAGTTYEAQAKEIVKEIKSETNKKKIDYALIESDLQRLKNVKRLLDLYQSYLDDEEAIILLLLH